MSDMGWLVVGVLGVAAGLSVPLARLSRPHPGVHVHPLRVVPGEGDRRFGSMCLEDEKRLGDRLRKELHHMDAVSPEGFFRGLDRLTASMTSTTPPETDEDGLYDPELDAPWSVVTELGPHEVLADPVEGHWAQVAEMLAAAPDEALTAAWRDGYERGASDELAACAPSPEPTVAEVAASRAAHGYIPELDSEHPERLCGPEQPHEKPAGTESAGSGHLVLVRDLGGQPCWVEPDAERMAHTWDRLPAVVTVETVTEWGARCRAEIAGWRHEPWAVAVP